MNIENRRSAGVRPSPSMAIAMEAKRLRSQGQDIVDLSLGEPDFEPPAHVQNAAFNAVRKGKIRYGAAAGSDALRAAISAKFLRDNHLNYTADEITVANGAKQIIFDTFLCTLEEGDEVIIPTPCWVSYGDIVSLHGGKPVYVPCGPESGFKISAQKLAAAITPRTRWLMLNSPSNPTGAIYTREEYLELEAVLRQHDRIFVLSDEIYEHILLSDAPFISFGEACPSLCERTLLVNGVSKAYAMTGWRVGYAAGPKPLIAALNKMQSQSVTSVCGIAQEAALAALCGDQSFVTDAAGIFSTRAQLVAKELSRINGVTFSPPPGAFYAFIGVEALIGKSTPAGQTLANDADIARYLLNDFGVSCVPGEAFGMPGFIRLSIAASEDELKRACARLEGMVITLIGDAR